MPNPNACVVCTRFITVFLARSLCEHVACLVVDLPLMLRIQGAAQKLCMTLAEDIRTGAQTLRDVSSGLASALRSAASRRHASATVIETFREAESLSLTVSTVLESAEPMLALFSDDAPVVGRAPRVGEESARVRNGFDSVGLTLLILLQKASDAVSDVAASQAQWLVPPLQAKQDMEAMKIHHGQLRAMYGILHLVVKIIQEVDVSDSLFLDVKGDHPRPELEPSLWRSTIKVDPLFGRFFGFHYKQEMRHVLRVVNIARGSITTAAKTTSQNTSPFVRNLAALGWGWVYSNMTLLNNIGVTIDGASQIGKDQDGNSVDIEQVRAFMNLAEEPIISGVSALASADVAVQFVFDIVAEPLSRLDQASLRSNLQFGDDVLIATRLLSAKPRPIDEGNLKRKISSVSSQRAPGLLGQGEVDLGADVLRPEESGETADERPNASASTSRAPGGAAAHPSVAGLAAVVDESGNGASTNSAQRLTYARLGGVDIPRCPDVSRSWSDASREAAGASGVVPGTSDGLNEAENHVTRATTSLQQSLAGVADSSMLASAIKNEFERIHSNMSSMLTPEAPQPATALILNFHGGGFVSQSSAGHSIYLKEWACEFPDSVMLCVDYKLAPEEPFPTALNECVYAYQWAIENCTRLGTRAEKIILCGDSAGGNLAVAVALKLQSLGLRCPDGICLGYPALYVNVAWSPSRLLSFFDPLLPLSVMDICLRAYVPEGERPHANLLLSPLVADASMLKALPPIAVVSGSLDPLLDDTVQFAHNLRRAGRTSDQVCIVESLPHGFLNMFQVSKDARNALNFLTRNMGRMLDMAPRGGSTVTQGEASSAVDAASVSP